MNEIAVYTLGSVFAVSLISLVGLAALSVSKRFLAKTLFVLVSLAAGTLFGGALLHLLPEAFREMDSASVSLYALGGILAFFVFEKFLKWRHVHAVETECDNPIHKETSLPRHPVGHLVLASDAIHNLIDGIIIATSYFISVEVGIAATIAIAIHEIPQEISDFGVLLHAGFGRKKALVMNFVSALTALVGAGAVLAIGSNVASAIPAIGAFAAGSFIYIAGSDLIPEIHKTAHPGRSFIQFVAIAAGIGIMYALLFV